MDRATSLAAELLEAAEAVEGRQHARQRRRVARLVQDEASRAFVQQLTDQVLRIDDPRRAADRFHDLVTLHPVPTVAGPLDRVALGLGARMAPLWPRPVMALVTRRLRREATGDHPARRGPGAGPPSRRPSGGGLRPEREPAG